jgi:hypothetical protein
VVALRRFHILLIACGIVFTAGFAVRELIRGTEVSPRQPYLAALFGAAALGLSVYLVFFLKRGLRR